MTSFVNSTIGSTTKLFKHALNTSDVQLSTDMIVVNKFCFEQLQSLKKKYL